MAHGMGQIQSCVTHLVAHLDVRPADSSSWATAWCPRMAALWSAAREKLSSVALMSAGGQQQLGHHMLPSIKGTFFGP